MGVEVTVPSVGSAPGAVAQNPGSVLLPRPERGTSGLRGSPGVQMGPGLRAHVCV